MKNTSSLCKIVEKWLEWRLCDSLWISFTDETIKRSR